MILAYLPTSNPWVRGSNPFRRASLKTALLIRTRNVLKKLPRTHQTEKARIAPSLADSSAAPAMPPPGPGSPGNRTGSPAFGDRIVSTGTRYLGGFGKFLGDDSIQRYAGSCCLNGKGSV